MWSRRLQAVSIRYNWMKQRIPTGVRTSCRQGCTLYCILSLFAIISYKRLTYMLITNNIRVQCVLNNWYKLHFLSASCSCKWYMFCTFHWLIAVLSSLSSFYRISSEQVELMCTHTSSNSIMAPQEVTGLVKKTARWVSALVKCCFKFICNLFWEPVTGV